MSQPGKPYDCGRAQDELDAFVRGELSLDEAERMQLHLDRCGHCASVARYEQAFRERLRRVKAGGACPDTLRQRIEHLLQGNAPDVDRP